MPKKVFAIVDCNNFYVSCERVFNPKLLKKPVIVLSNNDGCLIACSNEVKDLGIAMGTPYFKFRQQAKKLGIHVLSSNYTLYGDMSSRVMQIISEFGFDMEVYSIDEVFLEMEVSGEQEARQIASEICKRVQQCTGIPVSVGVATTKTLAKIANKIAKKDSRNQQLLRGVCCILNEDLRQYLEQISVADVWGIGRQYTKMLKACGVLTASDFVLLDSAWIKHKMTIQGKQTWLELQGFRCLYLNQDAPASQSIASTKSFGKVLTSLDHLSQTIATHTAIVSAKLRSQNLVANSLYVFVMTNRFKEPKYYKSMLITFEPTNYTPNLIAKAIQVLNKIYLPNLNYCKSGVIALQTQSINSPTLQDLFVVHPKPVSKTKQLKQMLAVDSINHRFGRYSIVPASSIATEKWTLQSNYRTPRYTTVWQEILTVK